MSASSISSSSSDTGSTCPRRVLSIERVVRGGMCRSCGQTLSVGDARIKVAYPDVLVQYAVRIGSPSFFMHLACFATQPVDYSRTGANAYKDTLPVQGFAVNPEADVIGFEKFPELHHCFDQSRVLWEQQAPSEADAPADVHS